MQKYLHKHFLREGHNGLINDVKIVYVDKTDPSDPIRRDEFGELNLRSQHLYDKMSVFKVIVFAMY